MTITQNTSAPLSRVNALAESDRPYRIRAFTRDAKKNSTQELIKQGVDIVVVSLVVGNVELVTNFWEHNDMEREIAEGKMPIDAAKSAGVGRIVWSALVSQSNHYRRRTSKSRVPFVEVQAGFYATNFLENPAILSKQEDGSFAIAWLVKPTTVMPIIDITHDYGFYVRRVLELPVFPFGTEVLTCGELITVKDLALQLVSLKFFSSADHIPVTGKRVVFKQITIEEMGQKLAALGFPPHIVTDTKDAFASIGEFGCDLKSRGPGQSPRTWGEFVKLSDWNKVLV
ncbi:hypothetical protein B0H10DRAFT_2164892 [Mycena sp. CBHHK59/15]|nr:hypothetical protein B0H10DRAFT_2164892 [Mycena sp. CBHHK59/15]